MTSKMSWQTSSFCDAGTCVGVLFGNDQVHIVNTLELEDQEPSPITVSTEVWASYLDSLAGGRESTAEIALRRDLGSNYVLTANNNSKEFSPDEWTAFVKGVVAGEFSVDVASEA